MVVASRKTVKPLQIKGKKIGGVNPEGQIQAWVLFTLKSMQFIDTSAKKGFFHPEHNHPEHEAVGYCISGRIQMGIGDQEYILEPGDSWHHPVGVNHWSRALEDTHAIEVHSPPRPEFSTP